MKIHQPVGFFAAVLLALTPVATSAASHRLPVLGADQAKVSVSGLSSGAFMAVQYDVAFSAEITGAGIIAGGPYDCYFANMGGILTCMQGAPDAHASYDRALGLAGLDEIDPPANIAKQKIYLFSGTQDQIVKQSVMDSVRDFYRIAQVPAANLQYVNTTGAGHAFISANFGNGCDKTTDPYVNECTVGGALYDQPGAILTQLYGPLKPKATSLSAQPVAFDQTPFGGSLSGMARSGYVYVPASCRKTTARCAVHVVFHGCGQSAAAVKDAVYGKLGYNEWADTNGIIMLYPQVNTSLLPFNPKGCWDWWGYSGPSFQTKGGNQLSAVHAMVQRLTS